MAAMRPTSVLLIAPAFPEHTFWNNKAICRVAGARHTAIPLGLLTVAALLPPDWSCRLIDLNCRLYHAVQFSRVARSPANSATSSSCLADAPG